MFRLNYVSLLLCFLLKILAKSTKWTDPTRVDKEVHKVDGPYEGWSINKSIKWTDPMSGGQLTSPQSGRTQ